MKPEQYRDALERLDLTQAAAGELFGVGDRTSRRWISGEAEVPPTVAMLLKLMLSKQLAVELDIPKSAKRPQAKRQIWTLKAKQKVHVLE